MKNTGKVKQPKFIVDLMLGKLARYLRIMGYDTLYPFFLTDDEIVDKAFRENRIVLTRDYGLFSSCRKRGIESVLIREDNIVGQLNQLYCLGLVSLEIDPLNSRCPRCNHPLRVTRKPPLKVHSENGDKLYFICDGCGSIYWIGRHWRTIRKILGDAYAIGCD